MFDILYYNSVFLNNKPFEYRLQQLFDIQSSDEHRFYTLKEYIKLEKSKYFNQVADFNNKLKSMQYETDGIIFAPSSKVVYKHFLNSKIVAVNQTYSDMITFKWKPLDKISIDFYILEDITLKREDDKINYMLLSGASSYDINKLNLQRCKNYYDIVPAYYHNLSYSPIQFYINENLELYKFQSKDDTLNNKIGEFLYINGNWTLMRIREDRSIDLSYGLYYGNDIKFARDNYYSIINPLTLDMLTSKATSELMKDIYFKKSDNTYSGLRHFNSSVVKTQLFYYIKKNFLNAKSNGLIVDLCSGKGQDLYKISKLNFKNNVFIDVNSTSITELNNRLAGLNSNNKSAKYNVYILDLMQDYKSNIEQLNLKQHANLISMNFAIHYFLSNESAFMNIVNMINEMASKDTVVLFTYLDGNKVFEKLKNKNEYFLIEDDIKKYSIVKKYKSKKLTACGQLIDIMLPFSNGEYYEEYLVNSEYLKSTFAELGFKVLSYSSFSRYFTKNNKKATNNNLSIVDEEFAELYSYMILKKIK